MSFFLSCKVLDKERIEKFGQKLYFRFQWAKNCISGSIAWPILQFITIFYDKFANNNFTRNTFQILFQT